MGDQVGTLVYLPPLYWDCFRSCGYRLQVAQREEKRPFGLKVLGLAVIAVIALSAFAAAPVCAALTKDPRGQSKLLEGSTGPGISRISKKQKPSEQMLPALWPSAGSGCLSLSQ